MKKQYSLIFLTIASLVAFGSNIPSSKNSGYIENKGQIIDQNNQLNPSVKYLFNGNGLNVQLRANGFSYDTYRMKPHSGSSQKGESSFPQGRSPLRGDMDRADSIYFHRVDIEFINANKNPELISEQPSSDYTNYYTTGTPEEGVLNVRRFQKVTYINLYNGVDLQFIVSDNKPKFNFIIHPNADVSQIHWKYNGAFSSSLTDGKIILSVESGNMEEQIPESFLQEISEKVNVNYISFGENEFGFAASSFNKNSTLIIDPVPWATYFGGSGLDKGFGIVTDLNGNVYTTGYTNSISAIATSGAFQSSIGLGNDAFLVKLNLSGMQQWATYYGGSSDDYGWGICKDINGYLFMVGSTGSNSGISTSGAYQTTYGGGRDAFIAKFNSLGSRIWASYFGGNSSDCAWGVATDLTGNILLTGSTLSASSVATSGAYQTSFGGFSVSAGDAFIAKFSPVGSIQWATYYGGSSDDEGYSIVSDTIGNIYIAGHSMSTTGIATAGAHQTTFGGGSNYGDGFIAKFSSSGVRQWGTYFGGSQDDQAFSITVDMNNSIYFTGYALSTSAIATSGTYQTTYSGLGDAFIAKFNSLGSIQWATYFGGSGGDCGYGITTNSSGNIFITGATSSSSAIATTGAYQTIMTGYNNIFLAKFNSIGSRIWATYYGGNAENNGNGISTDSTGNIYLTGYVSSTSYIATSGAFQTTFGGGSYDAFVTAFASSGGMTGVLPVQLTSFDAKLENKNEVLCTWATASEVNNDFFEIQRSVQSVQCAENCWESIGKVNGNGTTNLVHSYQFTDVSTPLDMTGALYYRLKQVDIDGHFEYSKTVAINFDKIKNSDFIISPNPANDVLFISNKNQNLNHSLIIISDMLGRKISEQNLSNDTNEFSLSINNLKTGVYFLTIQNGDEINRIKFVKE